MIQTILKKGLTQLTLMICIGVMSGTQAEAFSPVGQKYAYRSDSGGGIKTPHNREIIVLVHGLLRTSLSMWPLKIYLERQGYEVYSYNYPSLKYSIQEQGVYLHQFIKHLLAENPGVKINFITHSLGGIISREALSQLSKKQLKNMGSLIMLAPPNQGSQLAQIATQKFSFLTSSIKPLPQLSSDNMSYVHFVSVPNVNIEIIAGQYDHVVPLAFARLHEKKEPVLVNSGHTFIMNNAKARQLIIQFLQKGTFTSVQRL